MPNSSSFTRAAKLPIRFRCRPDARRDSRAFSLAMLLVAGWSWVSGAETLRVACWSMQPGATPEMFAQAAVTLRQLKPDVLLLEGVKDWQTCNQLAKDLEPTSYKVTLCSSFPDPATGQPAKQQLSILSQQKPYFFWSEAWTAPEGQRLARGGFAFIALQVAKQRLGFYCVRLAEETAAESAARQLQEHMRTVKRWEANSVQLVAVGGNFGGLSSRQRLPRGVALLQQNGFADACFDLPLDRGIPEIPSGGASRWPATYLLAERGAFGLNAQEISTSGQVYLVCDLELDPARVAAGWTSRAQELERRALVDRAERARAAADSSRSPEPLAFGDGLRKVWWVVLPVAVILIGLGLQLRRSRRARSALPRHIQPALLPGVEGSWSGASSYTVVLSPPSVSGSAEKEVPVSATWHPVVHEDPGVPTQSGGGDWTRRRGLVAGEAARSWLLADLGRWLKQKLVRSLIADRQQLLESQRIAALKAKAVDERLSKIEHQIQQQTGDYERRIDELTRDLLAAKEENRELIRSRIAQVKLEMEAVRTRLRAQAGAEVKSDPRP